MLLYIHIGRMGGEFLRELPLYVLKDSFFLMLYSRSDHMSSKLPRALILHEVSVLSLFLFYIGIADSDTKPPHVSPSRASYGFFSTY